MTLDIATRIVGRLGPCAIAIDRERRPDLARQLALLGCIVTDRQGSATAVIGAGDEVDPVAETLVVLADPAARGAVEPPLLARGWRRHPAGLIGAEVTEWSPDRLPSPSFYRRRPDAVGPGLLDRGADADAAIARLAIAADLVRPGDRVLVGGDDAEAGGAIVAVCSRARRVETAAGVRLDAVLAATPRRSLDVVIVVADAASVDIALADAIEGALKADGRLILGWRQEDDAIEPLVEDRFIVERRYRQADGGTLVVASANPLDAGANAPPYRHPAFHRGEGTTPVLVDFAGAYENPHLYRVMVQLGERLGDEVKLARLAECVLDEAGPASADRGAAIAVLGYRVLDLGLDGSVAAVESLIDVYIAATEGGNAPHVLRWRLSLLFLAARLAEMTDRPAVAIERFHAASLADWAGFSPILATKAVAAAFHEARLHLASGGKEAALACFRRGLDTALAAAAAPHERLIGDPAAPLPFYCQELAEVMDMGGQCAVALASAHLLDRDPGLFWRQVDTKRFGLFTWADGLAREQTRLRAA